MYNSGLLSRAEVPADARYDYAQAPPDLLARARNPALPGDRPAAVPAATGARGGVKPSAM